MKKSFSEGYLNTQEQSVAEVVSVKEAYLVLLDYGELHSVGENDVVLQTALHGEEIIARVCPTFRTDSQS